MTGINYIFKYIKIKSCYFKLQWCSTTLRILPYFWSNSLSEKTTWKCFKYFFYIYINKIKAWENDSKALAIPSLNNQMYFGNREHIMSHFIPHSLLSIDVKLLVLCDSHKQRHKSASYLAADGSLQKRGANAAEDTLNVCGHQDSKNQFPSLCNNVGHPHCIAILLSLFDFSSILHYLLPTPHAQCLCRASGEIDMAKQE